MNSDVARLARGSVQSLSALVAISLLLSSPTYGQAGLTGGTEYGFGIIVRGGSRSAQLEVAGGLAPLLVFVSTNFGDDILKVYFPVSVGAKLSFGLSGPEAENRFGVKLGATYNSLMKMGFGGGVDYQLSKKPNVFLGAGLMIFPQAEDKVRIRINEDDGTSFTSSEFSAPLLIAQFAISLSILFG